MQPDAPNVEARQAQLIDLAVETWRLDRWVALAEGSASLAAPRFVARKIDGILKELGFQTLDLTGLRYEPGLAAEVVGTVPDPSLDAGEAFVEETVSPVCLRDGKVVRFGQIVTRTSGARSTENTR